MINILSNTIIENIISFFSFSQIFVKIILENNLWTIFFGYYFF